MHRLPVRETVEGCDRIFGPVRNVFDLCKEERVDEALQAVDLLDQQGVPVSRDIIYNLLQGCTKIKDLKGGKRVHCLMVKHGLDSVSVLGDFLIRLYAFDGSLREADEVFLKISKASVFTWNSIISAHANLGQGARAIELYLEMQQRGTKSDTVTLLVILKACSSTRASGEGRIVHDQVIRSGKDIDIMLGSSLVDMYAKCGDLEEAHRVFDSLTSRDVVSWGAIMAGYAAQGHGFLTLELFQSMQKECIKPNEIIFWCVLKACGSIWAILQGRQAHQQVIKHGIELNDILANSLIDMYANSGSLEDALKVFRTLFHPSMASWGALISGFSRCGHCELAVGYLDDMKTKGLKPDDMIYTSILNACSHAGLLEDGYRYFNYMVVNDDITPSIEHYGCMVDLLGRLGCLREATKLLQRMPFSPNAIVWLSLLSSCKTYHDVELGRQCFNEIIQLDPKKKKQMI